MQANAHEAIHRYLTRVSQSLSALPGAQKDGILSGIESHIYEALEARTGGRDASLEDVNAVLAEMDPPESYAQAARDSAPIASRDTDSNLFGRHIPRPLRFALIVLGVAVCYNLVAAVALRDLSVLAGAALSALLFGGLYIRSKLAYVVTIVAVAYGVIATAVTKGAGLGIVTLVADCLVLIPVLLSTDYFFGRRADSSSGPACES